MYIKKQYKTYTTTIVNNSSTGEVQINLNSPPESDQGWIIIEPGTTNEETCFFHRVVGNTVFSYGVNRTNPVSHSVGTTVFYASTIDYLNYLLGAKGNQLMIYKSSTSNIIVLGGELYISGAYQTIENLDTSLGLTGKTLIVNSTSYIHIENNEYKIKSFRDNNLYYVGSVVTDGAGVVSSITPSNIFHISSQGQAGSQGPTGPQGVTWRGTYSGATTYATNDIVYYGTNGNIYICILGSVGNIPTNTTYWTLFLQKGTDGAGIGDMVKATYDTTNNGIVDNSERLGNQLPSYYATDSNLTSHTSNVSNPHGTTKSQVGLSNVDNTSDIDKPISTATQAGLDSKSNTTHDHTGVYVPNVTTTRGDIIIHGPSGITRLPLGLNGQVIKSDGVDVIWGTGGSSGGAGISKIGEYFGALEPMLIGEHMFTSAFNINNIYAETSGTGNGGLEIRFYKNSFLSVNLMPTAAPNTFYTPRDISTIAKASGVTTIVTSTAHGLIVGDKVRIGGIGGVGSGGGFNHPRSTVLSTPTTTSFTCVGYGPDQAATATVGFVAKRLFSSTGLSGASYSFNQFDKILMVVHSVGTIRGSDIEIYIS